MVSLTICSFAPEQQKPNITKLMQQEQNVYKDINTLEVIGLNDLEMHLEKIKDVDWLWLLPQNCELVPNSLNSFHNYTVTYDAIWGLIAERANPATNSLSIQYPQVLELNGLEELLSFHPYFTLSGAIFVRASCITDIMLNSNIIFSDSEELNWHILSLEIFSKYRAAKVNTIMSYFSSKSIISFEDYVKQDICVAKINYLQKYAQDFAKGLNTAKLREIRNEKTIHLQNFSRSNNLVKDRNTAYNLANQFAYCGFYTLTPPGASSLEMFTNNDDSIVKNYAWIGSYEYMSTLTWVALVHNVDGIILDIGGYDGLFSLLASQQSRATSQIYCFEPYYENFARIKINIRSNNAFKVEAVPAAVSDVDSITELYYFSTPNFLTFGPSLKEDHKGKAVGSLPVRTVAIDSFLDDNSKGQVKLVKIDVEGNELLAIKGMHETILSSKPDILIEVYEQSACDAILDFLPDDYKFYVIDDKNLNLVKQDKLLQAKDTNDANRLLSTKSYNELLNLLTRVAPKKHMQAMSEMRVTAS